VKIVSWNTNGLRACVKKGFMNFFQEVNADIFCIQETKMQQEQSKILTPGYFQYWNSAKKKGYSGTAIFTKTPPISVDYGMHKMHNDEGRIITLEYSNFYLVNCYSPHSQRELSRLDFRMQFENDLLKYISYLKKYKEVIICGDLNVAHNEIDLKNPKANIKNAGFTTEERNKFQELLSLGMVDAFRERYPDLEGAYTWWSYRTGVRERNIGWRIDYCIISKELKRFLIDAKIHSNIYGSDHCPIDMELII